MALPAANFCHPDDAPKLYQAYQYVFKRKLLRLPLIEWLEK
jgi:hypothetical protein